MRRAHQPQHSGQPEGDRQTTVVLPGRHAAPSAFHGRRWLVGAAAAIAAVIVVIVVLAMTVGRHRDADGPRVPTPVITPGNAEDSLRSGSPTPTADGSAPGGPGTATAVEQGGAGTPEATGQPPGAPNHPIAPSHKPKPSRTAEPSRSPHPTVSASPTPQPTASTTPSGAAIAQPIG